VTSQTDQKKALILNAAYECFSSYGYTKSTFQDVARRAGISRASLYSYFQNKQDLFITMNRQINDRHYQQSVAILAAPLSVREKTLKIIDEWIVGPYVDIQRTPYSNGWLDELVSISKQTEDHFRELFIRSLVPLVGEERAEVIVFSIRGLMDDRPGVEHLTKRIEILVAGMT
jgi:AcrR family transcriptional regulator